MDLKNLSILFVVISIAMVQGLTFLDPSDESNYNKEQRQSVRMELDHYRQDTEFSFKTLLPLIKKTSGKCLLIIAKTALSVLFGKEEHKNRLNGLWETITGWKDKAIEKLDKFYNTYAKPKLVAFWTKAKPKLIEAGQKCWALFQEEGGKYAKE